MSSPAHPIEISPAAGLRGPEALTWRRIRRQAPPHREFVRMRCRCHAAIDLRAPEFSITAEGFVQPAARCPNAACGLHEYVRLVGFPDGEAEE